MLHRGLQWDRALFAGSDHRGSVLHSLTKRGLNWCFTKIVSLSQGLIVYSHPIFAQLEAGISPSSKRREYHVDRRSKKAALFFMACDANPDTRVKIPDAMRIKRYSPSEAADRSLQDAGVSRGG